MKRVLACAVLMTGCAGTFEESRRTASLGGVSMAAGGGLAAAGMAMRTHEQEGSLATTTMIGVGMAILAPGLVLYFRGQRGMAEAKARGDRGQVVVPEVAAQLSPPRSRAEQLSTVAREAAANERCGDVMTVAAEIFQLDRDVYKQLAEDPAIERCRVE